MPFENEIYLSKDHGSYMASPTSATIKSHTVKVGRMTHLLLIL